MAEIVVLVEDIRQAAMMVATEALLVLIATVHLMMVINQVQVIAMGHTVEKIVAHMVELQLPLAMTPMTAAILLHHIREDINFFAF